MSERVEEIRLRWRWPKPVCKIHGGGEPMGFPACDWAAHAPEDIGHLLAQLADAERAIRAERDVWTEHVESLSRQLTAATQREGELRAQVKWMREALKSEVDAACDAILAALLTPPPGRESQP